MNKVWADLHCHSHASDGSLSPKELVKRAKECGLHGLSITDHDTLGAYAEAIPVAQELGLHLGTGIEFSCVFEGYDVHLLGYDFDLSSSQIKELCDRHHLRRESRNLKMLEKLRLEQIEISPEELKAVAGESVGRPHIAHLMVQKGYVGSVKEAFHRFLGEGKKCYVRGESLSVDETIEVIHGAKGKAFIAHPHLALASFPLDHLLEKPWDGIECFYAKLSLKSAERWIEIAKKKGWLMSGGSDFHGDSKPLIPLGSQGVSKEIFYQIFEKPVV